MQQENKGIYIFELLLLFLKKWKLLVVVILVFASLGTGVGVVKYNKNKIPQTKVDLSALEATMTEEEISDVKSAASIIEEYRVMYNSQKEYNKNSIYQNLDPFNVKTATLKYYVDNDYRVSYPVISETNNLIPIVQTYTSVLSKDALYERMSKEIDTSVNPLYFSEMVSVSTDIQDTGLFVITVMADTNEHLEKMVAIVKEELTSSTESIIETYGSHTLTLAFESVQSESISSVYDQQQLNIQKLTTITKAISDTEATFSGNQLTYLKSLIHEELEEGVSVVKYTVIGCVLGFFFLVCVELIKYLISGTIKTVSEIESSYGVEVLGVVKNDKEKANQLDVINTKLGILAKKQSLEDICIVVDSDVTSDITKTINVEKLKIIVVSDVENNAESLKMMADSAGVVLLEKLGVSKEKDISYVVSHAKQYGVPVIGAIVIA